MSLCLKWGGHACLQWGLGCAEQSAGGAAEVFELGSTRKHTDSVCAEGSGPHPAPGCPLLLSHSVKNIDTCCHLFVVFSYTHTSIFILLVLCHSFSPSDSSSHLLWVTTETLGRVLRCCQLVLEGGEQPTSDQNYFQSAVRTTVVILDSILYLTSMDTYTQRTPSFCLLSCLFTLFAFCCSIPKHLYRFTDHCLFHPISSPYLCKVSCNSEDGLQRRVCALLSLPWVCENKSVSAYKTSGFPLWLPALAQRLSFCYCECSPFIGTSLPSCRCFHFQTMCVVAAPDIQADCVLLLALLRHGVCETWRACVFSKTLQSPDEVVRAAAVGAFPLLLHHLGNTHHSLISTALLYVGLYEFTLTVNLHHCVDCLRLTKCSSRLEDSSELVKKELARIVGQLSCVRSELSQLSDAHKESTPEILCHTLCLASEHAGNTSLPLRASFVEPFLPLLRKQVPSSVKQGISCFFVCLFFADFLQTWRKPKIWLYGLSPFFLAFLEALPHLCQHVSLVGGDSDSQAVLCALIGLMEDPNQAVRIRFSQSVRCLLTETARNSEQGPLNDVSNSAGVLNHFLIMCCLFTRFMNAVELTIHVFLTCSPSSWFPVFKRHSTTLKSTEMMTCGTLLSSLLERLAGTGGLLSAHFSCVYLILLSIVGQRSVFILAQKQLRLHKQLFPSAVCFLPLLWNLLKLIEPWLQCVTLHFS